MVSILSKIDVNKINRGNGMVPQAGKKTITKKKETVRLPQKRWHNWFPFVFFYGGGKFQPIYFFVTVFSILSANMLAVKVYSAWIAIKNDNFNPEMISTGDLATVLTFVSSLILLYNGNKKINHNNGE